MLLETEFSKLSKDTRKMERCHLKNNANGVIKTQKLFNLKHSTAGVHILRTLPIIDSALMLESN